MALLSIPMSRARRLWTTAVHRSLSNKALKLPEYPFDPSELVSQYTAPALAAAFSDREQTLRRCAQLLEEGDIQQLSEILTPFRAQSAAKDAPTTTALDEAFTVRHLDRIKKRLNRLPRQIAKVSQKRAAVVIPLCTMAGDKSPHVIFTLRSSQMRHHRGEVCFPGGMVDASDTCIENTCLREMEEEVGLPASHVNVLGILRCDWSNVASITGVAVTPVVGHIDSFDESTLQLNENEVECLFTVPLSLLVQDNYWIRPKNATPVFTAGPHLIWGLTAYVLDICIREVLLVEASPPEDPEAHVA